MALLNALVLPGSGKSLRYTDPTVSHGLEAKSLQGVGTGKSFISEDVPRIYCTGHI